MKHKQGGFSPDSNQLKLHSIYSIRNLKGRTIETYARNRMFVSMKSTSQISAGRVADDDMIEYSSSREEERRTGIDLRSLEQPHSSYCGPLSRFPPVAATHITA